MTLDPDLARAALAAASRRSARADAGDGGLRGARDGVREHGERRARARGRARRGRSRDHTLIAFGGAAPLHAARVAEKIGVARVIVPPNAGVGSAVGFLAAPISYELVKSRHMRLDAFDFATASALLAEMSRDARALVEPGARGAPTTERRLAYMRYVGQGHEITVPLPVRDLAARMPTTLRAEFEREYSVAVQAPDPGRGDRGAELVGAGLDRRRIGRSRWPRRRSSARRCAGRQPLVLRRARRAARRRAALPARAHGAGRRACAGPAIIAEDETSTFVTRASTRASTRPGVS